MKLLDYFRTKGSILVAKPKKVSAQVVHDEIDAQEEILLQELKDFLESKNDSDVEKIALADKLGFRKSMQNRRSAVNASKEAKSKMEFYNKIKQEQPLYKIISMEDFKKVLDKYDLIIGDVGNFVGEIPMKNLKEIENTPYLHSEYREDYILRYLEEIKSWDTDNANIAQNLYNKYAKKHNFILLLNGTMHDKMRQGHCSSAEVITEFLEFSEEDAINFKDCRVEFDFDYKRIGNLGIAGKREDFDATFVEDFYSESSPKLIVDEDPIVFRTLKNGFVQIITKWGEEANDPILQNPIEN